MLPILGKRGRKRRFRQVFSLNLATGTQLIWSAQKVRYTMLASSRKTKNSYILSYCLSLSDHRAAVARSKELAGMAGRRRHKGITATSAVQISRRGFLSATQPELYKRVENGMPAAGYESSAERNVTYFGQNLMHIKIKHKTEYMSSLVYEACLNIIRHLERTKKIRYSNNWKCALKGVCRGLSSKLMM